MFDLNVLCIGQEQPTLEIEGNENIWIEMKNDDPTKKPKYYDEIAPVMNYLDGIWYKLFLYEEELGGTLLCSIKSWEDGEAPFWVDPDAADCVVTLVFREESLSSFRAVIESLVEQSPIRTVMVFSRFQSDEQEVILGTFLIDDFFTYLVEGKILTNVCYVISDVVQHPWRLYPDSIVYVGKTRIM
jgi:hypothetical protein